LPPCRSTYLRTANAINSDRLGWKCTVASRAATIDGAISQVGTNGHVLKDGVGTLTFTGAGANVYGGTTTVTGGTLVLNKAANVPARPGD
jgi:autotransporter-associated beta strand protein